MDIKCSDFFQCALIGNFLATKVATEIKGMFD